MAEQTRRLPMERHDADMGFGPLSIFIRKLLNRSRLSTVDQEALARLPHKIQHIEAGTRILHEGDRAVVCPILLDGFTYRYKVAADGGRQIVALKVPGDALDFQSAYLHTADHDIRALTPVVLASVPLRAIEALADDRPPVARALLVDTILEGSISREWLLNIGRRNAEARLAHLLCELYYRIDEIAGAPLEGYEVPIKQEQLADLLGLTPVHINRMLKRSRRKVRSGRGAGFISSTWRSWKISRTSRISISIATISRPPELMADAPVCSVFSDRGSAMPRYFFHTSDGVRHIDDEGIELADDAAARREAVRYGGNLLGDDPDMLVADRGLRIEVTDGEGRVRFAVLVSALDVQAISEKVGVVGRSADPRS